MDFLARDPKRLALMKALLQQAKEVQKILNRHFQNPNEKSPNTRFVVNLKSM
jgi:hypothetical protein